jgi:hypothetical protein
VPNPLKYAIYQNMALRKRGGSLLRIPIELATLKYFVRFRNTNAFRVIAQYSHFTQTTTQITHQATQFTNTSNNLIRYFLALVTTARSVCMSSYD